MNFSSDEELVYKDFFSCLMLWLVLELVAFGLLPALGVVDRDRIGVWLWLSLPLGPGGAFLLASCSRFVTITQERAHRSTKKLASWLGQLVGVLGLAGMVFPFVMVVGEVIAQIFTR